MSELSSSVVVVVSGRESESGGVGVGVTAHRCRAQSVSGRVGE